MAKLYKSTETNFSHNGEGILKDISHQKVTLEGNGIFEYEFSYPITSRLFEKLSYFSIVKTNATKKLKNQLFRIYKISKPINGIVKFKAQHISYDLFGNFVEKVSLQNTSCNNALNTLLSNTVYPHKFSAMSDIIHSADFNIERLSPLEAIIGTRGSIIDSFGNGAKIVRDNFTIRILQDAGNDNNILIGYGKNIKDLNIDGDVSKIVTGIYPYATLQGGIDSDTNIQQEILSLPEKIIYSSKKSDYHQPFIIPVDFTADDVTNVDSLRNKSSNYFSGGKDSPNENYKISFLDLSSTINYIGLDGLYDIDLYDFVIVRDFRYNINFKLRVIKLVYLPDLDQYESIELGNQKSNIASSNKNESDKIKDEIEKTNNFWKEAIEHATSQITGNSGGHVRVWPPDKPSEIFFMDTDNPNTAKNILRINKAGIGFSKNGVHGPFETAWTSDGVFYANWITAGVLNANLIRTGSLQNIDGSLQIDLGRSNGLMTRKNGKNAIELSGPSLNFFDWDGLGSFVGKIFSSRVSGTDKSGLNIANSSEDFLGLSYQSQNNLNQFLFYILLDKYNKSGMAQCPITLLDATEFRGGQFWFNHGVNSIYNSTDNNLVVSSLNHTILTDAQYRSRMKLGNGSLECFNTATTKRYCLISPEESFFGGNNGYKCFSVTPQRFTFFDEFGNSYFFVSTTNNLVSSLKLYANSGLHVNGDFTVNGNKNCVQKTSQYGERLYYSIEDCESYLTDRSMEIFTVDEIINGDSKTFERVILLDNIFKDSISLDLEYTVEIIKQGWGDYRIKEQTKDYFIVESDRADFTFKYVITGKRKGFESERNTEVFIELEQELSNISNKSSYDTKYIDYDIEDNLPMQQHEYWRLYSKKH